MNNIKFDSVKKACIDAGAHDFINELPSRYETVIGERGFKLSGGQKQRIAIARGLLRKSQLLILDEATSALDSESERIIQNNIDKIKSQKIILIVAHRLSTIKNADNIIVLDNGKVSHFGSHNNLIKESEIYKKLWKIQSFN